MDDQWIINDIPLVMILYPTSDIPLVCKHVSNVNDIPGFINQRKNISFPHLSGTLGTVASRQVANAVRAFANRFPGDKPSNLGLSKKMWYPDRNP